MSPPTKVTAKKTMNKSNISKAAPKATPAKATSAKATPAKAPTPTPAPEPKVPAPEVPPATTPKAQEEDFWSPILTKFDAYEEVIKGMIETLRSLQREIKTHKKSVKTASTRKRKRVMNNHVPSGFQKPARISDAMKKFLNTTEDMMTRNDVTRQVIEYIKKNGLGEGKFFVPDAKIKTILIDEDKKLEKLPYFGMQRLLKHHYTK